MTEKLKKCQTCNHEIACNAWNRELCGADECYCETGDVTIYTRFTIGGEGCEYFSGNKVQGVDDVNSSE